MLTAVNCVQLAVSGITTLTEPMDGNLTFPFVMGAMLTARRPPCNWRPRYQLKKGRNVGRKEKNRARSRRRSIGPRAISDERWAAHRVPYLRALRAQVLLERMIELLGSVLTQSHRIECTVSLERRERFDRCGHVRRGRSARITGMRPMERSRASASCLESVM